MIKRPPTRQFPTHPFRFIVTLTHPDKPDVSFTADFKTDGWDEMWQAVANYRAEHKLWGYIFHESLPIQKPDEAIA